MSAGGSSAATFPGRRGVAPLGLLLAAAGCADGANAPDASAALTAPLSVSAELTVDASRTHQRIAGFGASSAWIGGSISEETADRFFSPDAGIGLSLLRVHIAPDGTTAELTTAKRAAARGVGVWATPWSPPGEWKTSGTDTNGGSLLPDYYQAWADRLSGFAAHMKDSGVPLLALSAQNEPNWTAEWETCTYAPEELVTFVGQYLGPALERDSPETRLLGPETIDWNTLQQFADPLLADDAARDALGIVAVHAYGGTPFEYSAPAEQHKELWETEVSYDDASGVLAALETARQVQRHLTDGGVNAFHYWWLVSDGSGSLMNGGELLPQAFGLGHYSKFVRPGYVRVEVPAEPQAGISSSAYYDPESHRTVLVLVNESATDLKLKLRVEGPAPVQVVPWVTDSNVSLERKAPLAFENPFGFVFASQSVTSLIFNEVAEPTESAGEGGAASANASDAGGEEASGDAGASSGGAEPDARGTGNGASAGGSSSSSPPKRGGYVACSTHAPAGTRTPFALFVSLALLAVRRRRSVGPPRP